MKTANERVLLHYIKKKSQSKYKFHFKSIHIYTQTLKKVIIKMSNSPKIAH